MLKWDTLRTSWLQNDILGCIIPNNPSKVNLILNLAVDSLWYL